MKKVVLFISLMACFYSMTAQTEKQRVSLNLEQLFDLAELNNRSLRISDFAVRNAQQSIKVAKNAQLPSVAISLSASYLGDVWLSDRDFRNVQTCSMPHFGNNFSFEATQVIYAGGAIKNAIESAKLQWQAALLEKEMTRQNVRFLLVGNYLELFKLENQEEVYAINIAQTRKLVSEIQNKQKEGLALRNDITRYELQLQSLEMALTQVRNGIKIINNKMVVLIGLPDGTSIEVDKNILEQIPELTDENYWQNMATDISPSIHLAKVRKDQALRKEKVVGADRLPSLALFAADKMDGPITVEVPPIDKNLNYWYVGVGLKYNLASLYTTNKSVEKTKIETRMTVENEALVQEDLRMEINEAHTKFVESFSLLQTRMKSLELATQNYEVVNNRYINDLALITDMLDASNSKLESELLMANARINILFNYYNLKRISGTL